MGLNPEFEGQRFGPAPGYLVGREKLREFASAVGAADPIHHDPAVARAAGFRDVIATPTFAVLIAQMATGPIYRDRDLGLDMSRVVHGDQSLVHHRPVVAGDELFATVYIDRIRRAGPHQTMTTRVELVDASGEPVCTLSSTLVMRGVAA